jgi:Sec-independent protein translocase protein TatA
MFGFSFSELCVVFLVLLLVFKPKEIIEILQKIITLYEKLKEEVELKKNEIILLEEKEILNKEGFTQQEILNEFEDDEKRNN